MGNEPRRRSPLLSVVIPVKDGAGVIGPCLHALARSDLPREAWERFFIWLIVGAVLYASYGHRHSRLRQRT